MTDYSAVSTALVSLVALGAGALAILLWTAAHRTGDRRIRFVGMGFLVLAVKSLFSIYTIHNDVLHHDVMEMIGAVFDAAMVAFVAAPFWMKE